MKTLVVLLGPTAVGKTELSIHLARHLCTSIFNADSRQIYRGLKIGTAAPLPKQMEEVKHFFVGTLALDDYYSAARYEEDVLSLLEKHFQDHDTALLSGGSMLYIDAVCNGIDAIPTVDNETRSLMKERLEKEGLESLCKELRTVDPDSFERVDHKNPRRIVHALEIYHSSGHTYSSFLQKAKPQRPFRILKIGLQRDRTELFDRINHRVDQMMADGFLDEARSLFPQRELNALNTVGYKELFNHIAGEWTLDMAMERIKKNTRVYAKKQMTWFKRDSTIHWFYPDDKDKILQFIDDQLHAQ